jgi:uncharacterized protein YhbP (UPF0306 family)
MVTFMVQGKNQFIKLGSTYSNNKHWAKQFFYVFEAWEVAEFVAFEALRSPRMIEG